MNATCNGDTKPFAGQPADVRSADHAVFGLSIEAAANSPMGNPKSGPSDTAPR